LSEYKTWACLNAEGKAVWGDVFPEGIVPVLSILAQPAKLEGINKTERVYFVPAVIGIIIAIALVSLVIVLMLRKR
jgi:hypothetical protein